SGTHTYTQLGNYTLQISVKEAQGPKDKSTSTGTVVEPMMPLINGKPNCPPDDPITDTSNCCLCQWAEHVLEDPDSAGLGGFLDGGYSNVPYSDAPVRYADGDIQLATNDLDASGF